MRHHHTIHKPTMLYSIGIVGFFSALHVSIISYYNSSFLSTFVTEDTISLLYIIISIVTIIGFLSMNGLVRKMGNFRASLFLIIIQIIIFYGLITTNSKGLILILFILGMSVIQLIAFTIDVFLQKTTDVGQTGSVRGFYMTSINIAWILGPLLGGLMIVGDNYMGIYVGSFFLLFPLLYLIYKNFNRFKDFNYVNISAKDTFLRILKNKDISNIFIINIVLQTFYAWMVIYTPLYLHRNIGFEWWEISIILTIMLLPFILIELPLGKMADRKYGEKEIMAMGFVIMGISTATLALFDMPSLIIWSLILFVTRIGAAAAEVMIETYFFKKVDGKDPEILSMFRITRPISFFIAPIITTVGLMFTTDSYLFVIIGVMCLLTLRPILAIKDTR